MILSEGLDITLECRGETIWMLLAGTFNNEEVASIREKIIRLIEDGSRLFIFDLEGISGIGDNAAPMFLSIFNTLKGKDGELKFIFKNETVHKAFQPYANIFQIFPDAESLNRKGFIDSLRRTGRSLSRKTGFRISRPLATFLLLILCGWFITLFYIINTQNKKIHEQQSELLQLTHWKEEKLLEINQLKERVRPLEQLGILRDNPAK